MLHNIGSIVFRCFSIPSSLARFRKDLKKSPSCRLGTLRLLIFLGFLVRWWTGPMSTVLFNALVSFRFSILCPHRQQQSYRAKECVLHGDFFSCLLVFRWYAIIFNVFPNLTGLVSTPSSAVYIIVWCWTKRWFTCEFSSIGIREKNRMDSFHDQYKLSEREQEIVRLLVDGMSYKEIAFQLSLSPRTVETHIYRIFKKCSVSTKLELINKMFPLRNPT